MLACDRTWGYLCVFFYDMRHLENSLVLGPIDERLNCQKPEFTLLLYSHAQEQSKGDKLENVQPPLLASASKPCLLSETCPAATYRRLR